MSTATMPGRMPPPSIRAIARAGCSAACIAGSGPPHSPLPFASIDAHTRFAMARTPLFALLQRAARIARNAATVDMPLDEFHGRGIELRVDATRRRLLQGAAAGLALSACAPVAHKPRTADVVIVGAGIAGLSAAWRLREAGISSRIYEAQSRVGGRMLSLRNHFPNGQVIELGGELIDTGHVRIRKLAQQMGLELDDLLKEETDADTWWFDGRRIDEAEIVR